MTGTPAVRASDAERERVVALLQDHAAEGRLTLEELAERVGAAYGAATTDELDVLTVVKIGMFGAIVRRGENRELEE